jgi:hypothetical protein
MKNSRLSAEAYLGRQIPGTSLIIRKVLERGRDRKLRVRVDCLDCERRGLHRRWENIESRHAVSCGCRQRGNHRSHILAAAAKVEKAIKIQIWDNRQRSNEALAKHFFEHLGHMALRVRPAVVRECIREIDATVNSALDNDPAIFFSASDYEIECSRTARRNRRSYAGFNHRGEWTRKAYRADRAPLPLKWARKLRSQAPFIWTCKCDIATRLAGTCDELFWIETTTKSGRATRNRRFKLEWAAKK